MARSPRLDVTLSERDRAILAAVADLGGAGDQATALRMLGIPAGRELLVRIAPGKLAEIDQRYGAQKIAP